MMIDAVRMICAVMTGTMMISAVMTGAVMIGAVRSDVMISVVISRTVMVGAMIGAMMINMMIGATMINMMIGATMIHAVGVTTPLPPLLMFIARYERFMVTLLVTAGGTVVMIFMMRWIVMSRRCMLLPMALTPTSIFQAPQTTSLEL
jgi:hypothetical protein